MHSVIFIAAARNTRHKLSSFSAAVIFVLRWAQCWRSGRSLALWRSADDGAGLVPASGGLPTPTRTANGARSARPSAHSAQPCCLRRTAVWLPRIDRLDFAPQVNDLGYRRSLPLQPAQSGLAGAVLRAKFRAFCTERFPALASAMLVSLCEGGDGTQSQCSGLAVEGRSPPPPVFSVCI